MNEPMRDLVDVIKERKEKQEARRDQILNNLKGVEVVTIQKVVNPKSRRKRWGINSEDEEQQPRSSVRSKNRRNAVKQPKRIITLPP